MLLFFFFLMIRRPPRSTQSRSSAASDVYKRQVTWYPDTEKEWAISLLNRYEINTEQHLQSYQAVGGGTISLDDTPGDFYTLEWAVSKRIFKHLDVGLAGYYQQQVTDTKFPSNVISPYLSSHIDLSL